MIAKNFLKICKIHEGVKRMVSSIKIPCLQFTVHDTSRRGKYLPWQILNLLSHTKRSQFELRGLRADFMQWEKVWQEYYLFYVCTQVKISKQFYQVVCDSLGFRPIPHHLMHIHMQAGHIGKKSGSFKTTLEYKHDHEHIPSISGHNAAILRRQSGVERRAEGVMDGDVVALASGTTTFVFVDKSTRKSTEAPDWWRQMYVGGATEQQKLGPFNIVDIPSMDNFFVHKMTVRWNDTDFYAHVNYQVFLQYCFEAANEAVNCNFFNDGFKCDKDILNRKAKEMTLNYIREAKPNDNINIYLWRGNIFPGLLHCGAFEDTVGGADSGGAGGAEGRGVAVKRDEDEGDESDVIHFSIEKASGSIRLSSDVLCQACIRFYPVVW